MVSNLTQLPWAQTNPITLMSLLLISKCWRLIAKTTWNPLPPKKIWKASFQTLPMPTRPCQLLTNQTLSLQRTRAPLKLWQVMTSEANPQFWHQSRRAHKNFNNKEETVLILKTRFLRDSATMTKLKICTSLVNASWKLKQISLSLIGQFSMETKFSATETQKTRSSEWCIASPELSPKTFQQRDAQILMLSSTQ